MRVWDAIVITTKSKEGFALLLRWVLPLLICFILPLLVKNMLFRSAATLLLALTSVDAAQKYAVTVIAVKEKAKKKN